MIDARDAVACARGLIGTPYGSGPGQLDCINLIKKVIRDSPGGDPKYTTATTVSLWQSYEASGKYRDLTERGRGVAKDVPAGTLLFKGKETGAHQPGHVGLATGEGTVVHASSAKQYRAVVETEINGQWSLWGRHKLIGIGGERMPDTGTQVNYRAEVSTKKDPLNMRSGPGKSYPVTDKLPKGSAVTVWMEFSGGWCFVDWAGEQGYVDGAFLTPLPPGTCVPETSSGADAPPSLAGQHPGSSGAGSTPEGKAEPAQAVSFPEGATGTVTRLRRADGTEIWIQGVWEVDHIIGGDD